MKIKWTETELKYFTKKIPVAERNDDAIVWFILSLINLVGVGYWIWMVAIK